MTLIEALVALVVMSFGMVALVGLQGNLRYSGDVAKQRSEAMRLAQEELESLRAFSVIRRPEGAPANTKDYEQDLLNVVAARAVAGENSNTTFSITRSVTPLVQGATLGAGELEPQTIRAQTVSVRVAWLDRSSVEQSLVLDTIISRTDPVFSVALGVTPASNGVRLPDNRNPVIPSTAKDLGNGSSVFRRGSGDPLVWVINNVTGVITGKCEILETAVSALTARDVETCKNGTVGYLLSGTIRFSTGATPNARVPVDVAKRLSVYLSLTPSRLMERNAAGVYVQAAGGDYPSQPVPACFTDEPPTGPLTQTLVNYSCVVYPNNQRTRNWWGAVLLSDLDIGTKPAQFKVCRYSGDYNGNGYTSYLESSTMTYMTDNEEHPAEYQHVSYSLARQNFLVIRGDVATCPLSPVDTTRGFFVDASTYQIQP